MNQPHWKLLAALAFVASTAPAARAAEMETVRVADDHTGFQLADSGRAFVPWGFNYDDDEQGRLIEDYWEDEWPKVEADFREMQALGANVVRIHLQFGKFMTAPNRPNEAALRQLQRLLALAERTGLYLDLTGLGCYHKRDVPAWYDTLNEQDRWAAQAAFWEAVAAACAASPAVFCYDLMNEPVVPGGQARDDWLGPPFAGKHFVQFITLDVAGRHRPDVARAWIERLVAAIRRHEDRHLITVGLVSWSLDRPGLSSGFVPEKIAEPLDFLSVHLYPERGKLDEAIKTLRGFCIRKPVVVEETFPLKCSPVELGDFLDRSHDLAAGWIGFYWGQSIDQCRQSGKLSDALTADWLELFQSKRPANK